MLVYNKLTGIFADFRHFWRILIVLIFNYLHCKSSAKTAYRQHAGGKGQFLIVNKKLRTTAARAAVHVVNIKPSTFNYHLFLYGGSAVGKRHHHRRRPPLAKAVFINVYQRLETACFGRKTVRFQGFSAANGALCCKYANIRNSRYLSLFARRSRPPSAGRC